MKNDVIRHRGRKEMAMQLTTIRIDNPDATNFILGQTHFLKSDRTHPRNPGRRRAGNQVRPRLLRGFRQMPRAKLRH